MYTCLPIIITCYIHPQATADSSGGEDNISGNQSANQKNKLRVPVQRSRSAINSDWDESVQSEVACCSSDSSSDECGTTINKAKLSAVKSNIQVGGSVVSASEG